MTQHFSPDEIARLTAAMLPHERMQLDAALGGWEPLFVPSPGPQTDAFNSRADITGYGGAAGGGKSALIRGLATTSHTRSLIIRQEKTTTRKFVQDITTALGTRDGYSSQTSSWTFTGPDGYQRTIEFAGLENEGDEEKQQGVDYDLKAYDELTQMREAQFRYTVGWARRGDTAPLDQPVRVIVTFNPPTTAEGRWVIKYFAPWLDRKHPNPAADGEIRWFATVGDNADYEIDIERGNAPFVIINGRPEYVFDPADYIAEDIITPTSRTFFHAKLADNPYLSRDGAYLRQLQSLPPTLRAQMLKGDFMAGIEDPEDQLIPTAWVEAAMARWQPRDAKGPMDSLGVDAARGGNMGSTTGATGNDKMTVARRHGNWFDRILSIKGVNVNDGFLAASQVIRFRTHSAPVHIDVIGIGTSPYDVLTNSNVQTIAVNGSAKAYGMDASGLLAFFNLRAELWWRLREALDPANPDPIFLPDDSELLADLTAPTWWLGRTGIQVEGKDDIKKRLKRSPDKGDAVVYGLISTPRRRYVIDGYNEASAAALERDYDQSRFDELKG